MLHRDVLVLQTFGLAFGALQQPRQPLRDEHLAGRRARARDPGPPAELGLDVDAQPIGVGARLVEQPGYEPFGLVEQGEQQVLAVHLGMAEPQGLGLRVVQRLLRLLRQLVRIHERSPPTRSDAASRTAMRSSRCSTRSSAA